MRLVEENALAQLGETERQTDLPPLDSGPPQADMELTLLVSPKLVPNQRSGTLETPFAYLAFASLRTIPDRCGHPTPIRALLLSRWATMNCELSLSPLRPRRLKTRDAPAVPSLPCPTARGWKGRADR